MQSLNVTTSRNNLSVINSPSKDSIQFLPGNNLFNQRADSMAVGVLANDSSLKKLIKVVTSKKKPRELLQDRPIINSIQGFNENQMSFEDSDNLKKKEQFKKKELPGLNLPDIQPFYSRA